MKRIYLLPFIFLLGGCGGTPTPLPTSQVISDPISMELVHIPAGEFLMGSDPAKDPLAFDDELPQRSVTLPEFYVGRYEVTNDQYGVFVRDTGYTVPGNWPGPGYGADEGVTVPKPDHPVEVSWDDAVAFSEWLSEETGMKFRLCTEAEWEKACRGAAGLIYPWGNTFDVEKGNLVFKTSFWGEGPNPYSLKRVGMYSPEGDSPYGVADMLGNVEEWVADWSPDRYYGKVAWVRGSMERWKDGRITEHARCALREEDLLSGSHGLRVCMSPSLAVPGQ